MAQIARPASDITISNFSGFPVNTAGNRYQNIDETTASSSDYISGTANTSALYECGVGSNLDPNIHTGHIVRFVAGKLSGSGSIQLTIGLWQGTTLIAQTVVSYSVTGLAVSGSFTLSEAEAANITDYSALKLRFSQQQISGRATWITWAEFEVPDVVAAADSGMLAMF